MPSPTKAKAPAKSAKRSASDFVRRSEMHRNYQRYRNDKQAFVFALDRAIVAHRANDAVATAVREVRDCFVAYMM